MRTAFCAIFFFLAAALAVCAKKAFSSRKALGVPVGLLTGALIPPVIGNQIIIASGSKAWSTLGCYIYFLGMDIVMAALINFTFAYCLISSKIRQTGVLIYGLLGADMVQLLLNLRFRHAFTTELLILEGRPYYRLIPLAGQTIHRITDYSILAVVVLFFLVKTIRSPKVNAERYYVILACMLATTVWESAYIFSRTPIDRAMVGFGVFGLLVYYFSFYYRPLRLLDSMLAHMAFELPEGLFFFDLEGRCIWSNKIGREFGGFTETDFEGAAVSLDSIFPGVSDEKNDPASYQGSIVRDGRNYEIEKHIVTDERKRQVGSFLSVRDTTLEQTALEREAYKASHDSLTGLYNRAGYDIFLEKLNQGEAYLLLIDLDEFKLVNDTYGHEMGDKVLQNLANVIRHSFREEDCACRIGGDEFVVFVVHAGEQQKRMIISRINQINEELSNGPGEIPHVTVSIGVAHGAEARSRKEWFEQADQALYEAKRQGRHRYVFFKP